MLISSGPATPNIEHSLAASSHNQAVESGDRPATSADGAGAGSAGACARPSADVHSIKEGIKAQGDKVRALKAEASTNAALQRTLAAEIETLKALKAMLGPDELGESGKKRRKRGVE